MSKGARMTVDVRAVGLSLLRGTRRAALTLMGFALIGVGLAGLVLPLLPGWLLIVGGLAMLAREYSWASLRSLVARRRRPVVVELPSEAVVIDLTPTLDARELVELGELEASDLG